MHSATLDVATGELVRLEMRPTQMRRLQVKRASLNDAAWLAEVLNREGRKLGTRIEWKENDRIFLHWD
jgi:poly-gamma-glutamate capsule biosynthesis protein CapA/YwtB (metallophosphatase superfamily)